MMTAALNHTASLTRTALVLLLLGLGLFATPLSAQPAPPASLSSVIDTALAREDFNGSIWGVAVANLNSGYTLYERNPHTLFTPASNTKLFTSAAALEQLGPDYRFETRVYAEGTVRDSVLDGNLVVRGAGDPTIGGREQEDDPTAVFRAWADSLRAAGINRITGNLIGDDDIFTDEPLGYGWSWDDTPYYYAAEIGGLAFNRNTVDVTIESRFVGMPGHVRWAPFNTDYVTIVNETETIAASKEEDEDYERPLGSNTIYLRTKLPQGMTEEESLTISNPTLYFTYVLRQVLERQGITVEGTAVDVDDLDRKPDYDAPAMQPVARYQSIPLSEIVTTLNRESSNLYAEQVIRTLGVEQPADSVDDDVEIGSGEMGVEAAMRTYVRAQIDTSRIQFADGSGLSRHNLVTPRSVVTLLTYLWNHPDAAVKRSFYDSLPVGGENGTLEYRFRGTAQARGQVRAKTGTLSNASALSGYVRTADGTPLAFAILCNHHITDSDFVREAQDIIVNALAGSPPLSPPE
jgi:D-alanyl-D-alanine carboxypeptidase/D-alanyl-D-alanine-endopeptidase (penicillin-binding protein 4)